MLAGETPRNRPLTAVLRHAWGVVLLVLGQDALGDTLVTHDGRVLEVPRVRMDGDHYLLSFEVGQILCQPKWVASVEVEGDMSDYVPQSETEREYLEQGFVRYGGRWMSKKGYQYELEQAAEARRRRTEELARHADFDDAWELETKHFRMRSNTSPEILDHYAALLEAYYELMDDRIGVDPTPSMRRTKLWVNVYKSQEEMVTRASDDFAEERIGGYFSPSDQSLNFFHDFKDPSQSDWVGMHECTHLLTYLIDQDYVPQVWINEAVADYFACAAVTTDPKGRVRIEPGQIQTDRLLTVQEAFRQRGNLPLAKLFVLEPGEFTAFHYAHAWSFVYFLQNHRKYAKRFEPFFKELYTQRLKGREPQAVLSGSKTGQRTFYRPEDIRDALLARLRVSDLGTLEVEWLDFIASIPIESAEARFKRAYQASRSPGRDSKTALADADFAIHNGFEEPRAFWVRGYLNIQSGERGAALSDFRTATELAPLDATFRADLAWALSGWWGQSRPAEADKPVLDEARMHFDLAALLEPNNRLFADLARKFRELHP